MDATACRVLESSCAIATTCSLTYTMQGARNGDGCATGFQHRCVLQAVDILTNCLHRMSVCLVSLQQPGDNWSALSACDVQYCALQSCTQAPPLQQPLLMHGHQVVFVDRHDLQNVVQQIDPAL